AEAALTTALHGGSASAYHRLYRLLAAQRKWADVLAAADQAAAAVRRNPNQPVPSFDYDAAYALAEVRRAADALAAIYLATARAPRRPKAGLTSTASGGCSSAAANGPRPGSCWRREPSCRIRRQTRSSGTTSATSASGSATRRRPGRRGAGRPSSTSGRTRVG